MSQELERQAENDGPDEESLERALPAVAAASSRKLIAIVGVALVVFLTIHYTPIGEALDALTDMDRTLLAGGGGKAAAWFVLITAGLMTIGMPRLVFYVLGGVAFGFWLGLVLALIGSLIGSFIMFRAARWGGRDWLVERFGKHRFLARISGTKPTVTSVALVRMLPVSNMILNVGLSLSRVGNRAFLFGTLLGFLPQGVVAVLVGSGVGEEAALRGAVQIGIAAVILVVVMVWSARRLRARKT